MGEEINSSTKKVDELSLMSSVTTEMLDELDFKDKLKLGKKQNLSSNF